MADYSLLFGHIIPANYLYLARTPIYETEATIIYEEANDTAFLLNLGQPLCTAKSAILNMVEQIKAVLWLMKLSKACLKG